MLTKFIPAQTQIKSLYWVRKEKKLDHDLNVLFSLIDDEIYISARYALNDLVEKWPCAQSSPSWFKEKCYPAFAKAEAMLNFLNSEG